MHNFGFTGNMNIEQFREFCLSLEDTSEKMPFGKFARRYESLLVFYVLGHMFCIIDIDDFSYMSIPATDEETRLLKAAYPDIGQPINSAMRNWITVPLRGSVPDATIPDLIRNAYALIRKKYLPKAGRNHQTKKSQ